MWNKDRQHAAAPTSFRDEEGMEDKPGEEPDCACLSGLGKKPERGIARAVLSSACFRLSGLSQ